MSLQDTIGDMEQQLELAYATINELQDRAMRAELERDSYRDQLYISRQERDEAVRTATQIETILEHTSMGLVQGVQKMRQDKATRRAHQNAIFEEAAAAGMSVPLFLRNSLRGEATARASGAVVGQADADEGHTARTASMAPAGPSSPKRGETLADVAQRQAPRAREPAHDPRLPGPVLVDQRQAADADARRLAELADMIGSRPSLPRGERGRDVHSWDEPEGEHNGQG